MPLALAHRLGKSLAVFAEPIRATHLWSSATRFSKCGAAHSNRISSRRKTDGALFFVTLNGLRFHYRDWGKDRV
jgi:hypothetical protein